LFGLLTLGALSASAADEEAPIVAGPEDKPGADVVWEGFVEYTLDSTGSSDDIGIVEYEWNITAPDTTVSILTSTSPTLLWTPTQYGVYKIIQSAKDAAGNIGYNLFTMDAYESIQAQVIRDTTVTYTHSVAVDSGSLSYTDVDITMSGGLGSEVAASVPAPDQLTEKLVNKGKFAGEWKPYYSFYNYPQYGLVYEDSTTKLSGSPSGFTLTSSRTQRITTTIICNISMYTATRTISSPMGTCAAGACSRAERPLRMAGTDTPSRWTPKSPATPTFTE